MKKITYISILVCLTIASFTACDLFGGGSGKSSKQIAQLTIEFDENTAKDVSIKTKTFNLSSEVFDLSGVANLVNNAEIHSLKFKNVKKIAGELRACYPETSLTNLKTIIIDDKIFLICDYAFNTCNYLENVTINADCTLGINVFPLNTDAIFSGKVDIRKYTSYTSAKIPVTISFAEEKNVQNIPTERKILTNNEVFEALEKTPTSLYALFKGYFAGDSSGQKIFDSEGKVITDTDYITVDGKWKYIGNVTLCGDWESQSFFVVFDPNEQEGGFLPPSYAGEPQEQEIRVGETNVKLKKNVFSNLEGVFAYWEWTSGTDVTTFTDGQRVTIDAGIGQRIELKAIWTKDRYQVTYMDSTATDAEEVGRQEVSKTVSTPTTTVLENPERTGYRFLGWYTENGEQFTSSTPITASLVVYAHWEPVTYTIKFDRNKPADAYAVVAPVAENGRWNAIAADIKANYETEINLAKTLDSTIMKYYKVTNTDYEYTHVGWSFSPNSVLANYQGNEKVEVKELVASSFVNEGNEIILYAVWKSEEPPQSTGVAPRISLIINHDLFEVKASSFLRDGKIPEPLVESCGEISYVGATLQDSNNRALAVKNLHCQSKKDGEFDQYYIDGFYAEPTCTTRLLNADLEIDFDPTKSTKGYVGLDEGGNKVWLMRTRDNQPIPVYAKWVQK